MKKLFAYYSLEGNCRELARCMAEGIAGETAEIVPKAQPIPPKGFLRLFKGGKQSLFRETIELEPFDRNVRDFDIVFVGGPVWAWNMAPPTRTFLSGTDWRDVPVALFCMSGGPGGATLGAMRALVTERGGRVVDMAGFRDLRRGDAESTRLEAIAWASGAMAKIAV